jgi:uncharacterized membrane protein
MQLRVPLLYVLLCLVLAGLIHIAAVLALPSLAPTSAWERLVTLGPANMMIQLPALTPGHEIMPMMAPDVRYAFCRFDLRRGPVRLKGAVPSDLWMVAFYTPQGDNFYTVSGVDMKSAQLDLVIAKADQPVVEAGVDAPEESDEVFVVKSPVEQGIAMIRAPLSGPSRAPSAEDALRATACGAHAN